MKAIWVLLLLVPMQFLQASSAGDSAEVKNVLSIGIRGHYGFIIPHSKQIKELSYANPWGVEAEIAWHLMGENIWRYCYCCLLYTSPSPRDRS